MNKVKGSDIKDIQTLKTGYDQDSIQLVDNKGNCYRLKVSEILTLIGGVEFETEKKKVHTYLSIGIQPLTSIELELLKVVLDKIETETVDEVDDVVMTNYDNNIIYVEVRFVDDENLGCDELKIDRRTMETIN